jgi:hypothetical protein
MKFKYIISVFILLFISEYSYTQVKIDLSVGTGISFFKEYSITKQNNDILSAPLLFNVDASVRIFHKKIFGKVGIASKYNIVSESNIESNYSNNGFVLGLGRRFYLFDDYFFDFSFGYIYQMMRVNTYITNSTVMINSNNIAIRDGVNLLNINKYAHGLYFELGLKTIDNLFITVFSELDLSKSKWNSLNGHLIDLEDDYLNFLGVKLLYNINIKS